MRIPDLAPAIGNTLLLGLLGTVGALLVAMALWPLACRHFGNRDTRLAGHGLLIVLRSTPELMLAFLFLLLLGPDRKSTRLNSSHVRISYAVFCLKKKKNTTTNQIHR